MIALRKPTFDLAAAAAISAVVHTAGIAALATWATRGDPAGALAGLFDRPQPPAIPALEPEALDDLSIPISLGIEESANISENWLGFEEPTPHEAPQSSVEQPEVTIDPMAGGDSPAGEEAAAIAAEQPTMPATPEGEAQGAMVPEAPEDHAEPRSDAAETEPPGDEAAEVLAAQEMGPPAPDEPVPAGAQGAEEAQPPAGEAGASPSSTDPGAKGTGDTPGEKSDKESIATALKKAITVRPGHPAAAQGLDIKTVRPRWRDGVRLTRHPKNPVVRVHFNRSGIVKKAEFVSEGKIVLDTGFADVNEPLLNAVYAWTAKGKALRELPERKPDAAVVLTFRILLVD